MIDVTKLYCGADTTGDPLRYGHKRGHGHGSPHATEKQEHAVPKSASERRPVVVWSVTRRCNLNCIHCYTDSHNEEYAGELTTEEAKRMIKELAEFKIPALLLSGGEPLIRKDIFELAEYARGLDMRLTFSTNGTLIDKKIAKRIKDTGFSYVGISFDGIGKVNDMFRGMEGAFDLALRGLRNCKEVEQKVGLRLTLTRRNYEDLHKIFDFIEKEGIQRACFYHLVYAGRGSEIRKDDLSHEETRKAVDIILERTKDFYDRGLKKDVLTVDNHADGPYIYMKLKKTDPERAEEIYRFLEWNGGGANSSGVAIGNIDFFGDVHADQFWQDYSFGNIKKRPFPEIWMDTSDPIMKGLKNRVPLLKGRCAKCKWIKLCGGSFRVRALRVYNDPWMHDPACYLTDEEIGLEEGTQKIAAGGE
jgi:radical SAM protein with 4Fe4S-binding SPASM domain